ncbi:MAG: hypothetical protein AAB250_14390 [Bdellovibrionota bacterium]
MSKNQILAIVAAFLLGAFWVWPNIEKTHKPTRAPSSTQSPQPMSDPVSRPIQRKKTNIKPIRLKRTPAVSRKTKHSPRFAKRVRVNFEKADRRPTSLPTKKSRKRDNVAVR